MLLAAIPLAHFRFASRSAYVNPTVLVTLKTSASRTIGRKEILLREGEGEL